MTSEVIPIPSRQIKCGQAFRYEVEFANDDDSAFDFTGWTGRFTISEVYGEAALFENVPVLTSGLITVDMTAVETLTLQDYCGCLFAQLDVDPDDGEPGERLQFRVTLSKENAA